MVVFRFAVDGSVTLSMVVTSSVVVAARVMGRQRAVHRRMAGRMADHWQFHLCSRPRYRAQHGSGHRTPNGEQDSQKQQEADTPGLHRGKGSRMGLTR